jgi:hypothetical protein
VIRSSQCSWGSEPIKRQRKTRYTSLEERIDVVQEQLGSLESRLAQATQLPDGTTEAPRFRPHSTLEATAPPSDDEQSFQEYTKQVEGMLGKYMLQYLMKQKWGEVRNGASSLALSTTEVPRDTQEFTTGTSGPSSSTIIPSEGHSHLSSYAQGIIPDFYSRINPDDGVHFGHQKLAVNPTASAPDLNNVTGNWGEMRGTGGFANRMSDGRLSTTTGCLPFVNEGHQDAQRGYSEALWPMTQF